MMESKAQWYFRVFRKTAREYLSNREHLKGFIRQASGFVQKHKNSLKKVDDDLRTMLRLLKAWFKGDYRKVPVRSIALIITAVIYLVSPIDAIPDFIPGLGFTDDVAVIAAVVKSILADLAAFKEWERSSHERRPRLAHRTQTP